MDGVTELLLAGAERLVGGGAVEAGDGDVVEAQVDAELGAVVDQVVEEHVAVGERARAVGDDVVAEGELPGLGQLCVGERGKGGAGLAAAASKVARAARGC